MPGGEAEDVRDGELVPLRPSGQDAGDAHPGVVRPGHPAKLPAKRVRGGSHQHQLEVAAPIPQQAAPSHQHVRALVRRDGPDEEHPRAPLAPVPAGAAPVGDTVRHVIDVPGLQEPAVRGRPWAQRHRPVRTEVGSTQGRTHHRDPEVPVEDVAQSTRVEVEHDPGTERPDGQQGQRVTHQRHATRRRWVVHDVGAEPPDGQQGPRDGRHQVRDLAGAEAADLVDGIGVGHSHVGEPDPGHRGVEQRPDHDGLPVERGRGLPHHQHPEVTAGCRQKPPRRMGSRPAFGVRMSPVFWNAPAPYSHTAHPTPCCLQ